MKKFWMVVTDGGGAPTARHPSIEVARQEASRLAAKCHTSAHVLEVVDSCAPREDVVWTKPETA